MGAGEADRVEEPTSAARIRVEKTGLRVEVAVPPGQAPRLLTAAGYAVVSVGVLVGPALTVRAVPADFPVWATLGLVAGQIGLLGLVALAVRSVARRDPVR
ncbi:hypothetical protein [Saccharothrix variisporea]|uniref:Uncharacterized protein n=1 Tax=Saccharothrix variisporea TaxID=543527 RepID=A0A495X2S6_9PSEU|nr:hypothetical protein [Saccharothrix variisporea]RKT68280.1 hypothetical protein DFJ66_1462 [Saccharothrix variisporea]